MRNVDASRFVGGMGEDEQAEALESDVVVGTYPMAQEGLDVPEFDTLFLATPQTSVEQAVGRIMRECDGKKKPLVVDYVDSKISICSGMFRTRSRVYSKLGVVAQGS
jgi:superfamily II DNA or RNA helicase